MREPESSSNSPSESPELRICIVSGADEIRLRSYVNHAIYAREHGLDFRLECGLDLEVNSKFDYKTHSLRRVLPLYDWIAWVDDDAFFTDFERDQLRSLVVSAEQADQFLVVAEGPVEPNGFWSRINTGVMLIRNDARSHRLLDAMNDVSLNTVREWWDDERDGLYTNGDQDEMWWALCTGGLLEGTRIVSHRELNSRGHYYGVSLDDAFIMHFCGHRDKPLGIARFADRFDVGHELVPETLLDRYSVQVRSPMNPVERALRAVRVKAISKVKPYAKPLLNAYRGRKSDD